MSVNVVAFFKPAPASRDWDNQELAEFYRVEASLIRSGVSVETDRGLSDEGDPWFIFCRVDTGDVIIHFARTDGDYVVASPAFDTCVRGRQFRPLIESLIDSHPLVIPKAKGDGKLSIHPAALLVALVATCFFKLGHADANAAEIKAPSPIASGENSVIKNDARRGEQAVVLDERATTIVLAAIAAAATWAQAESLSNVTGAGALTALDYSNQGSGGSIASLGAFSLDGSQIGQIRSHTINEINALDGTANNASSSSFVISFSHPFELTHNQISVTPKVTAIDYSPPVSHDPSATSAAATVVHVAIPAAIAEANAQTSTANSGTSANTTSTNSVAMQEVGLVLGGTLQIHLVNDLSGPEQQLVLSVVTFPTSSGGGYQSVIAGTSHDATVPTPTPAATGPVAATGTASAAMTTTTTTTTTAATTTATALATSLSVAEAAIEQFTAAHSNFQLIHSGNEVILYDPSLTQTNVSAATQETFSFPDGSSIFLIGLPATAHSAVLAG